MKKEKGTAGRTVRAPVRASPRATLGRCFSCPAVAWSFSAIRFFFLERLSSIDENYFFNIWILHVFIYLVGYVAFLFYIVVRKINIYDFFKLLNIFNTIFGHVL